MTSYLDDLFGVAGKTVLVTGGTRGIGRMIAEGFVRAGATVFVASRGQDAVDSTVAELSAHGTIDGTSANLATEAGAIALRDWVAERTDRLDVLVNNAGATWGEDLATYPDSAWDKLLALNVKAVFHLTRACTGLLQAAGTQEVPARVINIGSIDGIHVPDMETYAYSTSKAAVHQLTRHLAKRLAPEVTVNAIAPGPFESKMMAATLDAFGDAIAEMAPRKRIGQPDDMAGVAIYLASKAGAYTTGTIIPVDGGLATLL